VAQDSATQRREEEQRRLVAGARAEPYDTVGGRIRGPVRAQRSGKLLDRRLPQECGQGGTAAERGLDAPPSGAKRNSGGWSPVPARSRTTPSGAGSGDRSARSDPASCSTVGSRRNAAREGRRPSAVST
ncbi:hypothetical protein AB4Z54_72665, partial [Streptomyces sp. MCAF7]